ncbi:MAG: ANTAR domain-containing protein, partial [Clostridia bacterium]|nr:ANTAR domain-containing protein [Clostridia bacterium]
MMRNDLTASVMVVSQTDKACEFLKKILPRDQFSPILSVNSAGEANRELITRSVDIVVINAPLKDDGGIELAINISEKYGLGVLLMVKSEIYDQVTYQVENYGVLTLARPCTSKDIFQTMKLLMATQARMRTLERKTANLEEKMEEIRLVNRAKGLLMDHLKMTEAEAHRYIEKA